MMKRYHTPLSASAAIAAALALSPVSLAAQAVEIPTDTVIIAPQTPPPTVSEPTTVVPPEVQTAPAPTMATTPPPPARPAATTTTPTTTTRTTRATPTTTRTATPAPVPRASMAAPAVTEEAPAPVASKPVSEPVVAPVVTDTAAAPAAPASADNDNNNGDATMFGIVVIAAIAALVLAIWGFIAIGRRRSPARRVATTTVERPKIQHPAPIHAETAREPEPETTSFAAPASPTPINTVSPAPSMAHTGASVPLPRTMPATFEERDALMRRMIAAKPDRANPFKSPIQRYHRAKLIMQSLGRDFGETDPWIDLSQYPQNWPELARRSQAA